MVTTIEAAKASGAAGKELAVLESIQRRVLWLATNMVHYANHVRPNPDGSKIGGHQASSSSIVSILTALYFSELQAGDRVSVKPHGSPAFHAVQYLLGNLEQQYLTELRVYKGIQAYPSKAKDPDRGQIDFSTGSVGLGAVAPAFAALIHRYAELHFGSVTSKRFIAILGDAELDEGNVWEAATEDYLRSLGNLLWIVDLNRQSLDRVVPGIRAAQLKALFRESHWHVIDCKYGRRLEEAFTRPGGDALRRRIDDMSNEEYQSLIRLSGEECRGRLVLAGPEPEAVARAVEDVPDDELPGLLADLGGHDLAVLLDAFAEAKAVTDAPTVVFAYTIKGWGLPIAGHPLNHSQLLTAEQMVALREELEIPDGGEWDRFPEDSPEALLCATSARRLEGEDRPAADPPVAVAAVPEALDVRPLPKSSSQDALGRLLTELARAPGLGERLVTVAPDVAVSTSLGGWINRVGVFAPDTHPIHEAEEGPRLLRWEPGPSGQHFEFGISEMNLFMMLGQLGMSYELCGQHLFPIGTVYDPFVCRGLDALIYGLYNEAKMVLVGTPSGISLSPEGGAHQSTVTPSLGIELPNLLFYEPCFGREVEWTLLRALRECADREHGRSTYLRLSTKAIDQALLEPVLARLGEETLRRQVLAGGYRLIDRRVDAPELSGEYAIQIAVAGAMIPEAVAAARTLHEEGVAANVLNLTSPGLLYRGLTEARRQHLRQGTVGADVGHLGELIPPDERRAPIVTVHDSASHALAFLGSAFGAPVMPLGVDEFGQSGSRADLYRHYAIDAESIVSAALLALDLPH
ncbi:MAG: pyruvate dehydrogenase [Chloroflexi bacterium]|nr:pyruvate dehydrogenase [Chloroflexota bacterium]